MSQLPTVLGLVDPQTPDVVEADRPGAEALISSSTIVGLHFSAIPSTGNGFVGSAPVPGKVELEGIVFSVQGVPAAEDPHRFQLAIASEVPSNQEDVDAGDQLFPRASQLAESRHDIVVAWGDAGFFLPVGSIVHLNGRRFIARWFNGNVLSAGGDAYLGIVVHGVSGGTGASMAGFLEGEPVRER